MLYRSKSKHHIYDIHTLLYIILHTQVITAEYGGLQSCSLTSRKNGIRNNTEAARSRFSPLLILEYIPQESVIVSR